MKLTLNGTDYQAKAFSLFDLSLGEARTIKRNTGMSLSEWRLGLMTLHREDPDVFAGIVYVLRHRAGEQVDWADIDTLSTQELIGSLSLESDDSEFPPQQSENGTAPEPETPAPKKTPARRTTKPKPASK